MGFENLTAVEQFASSAAEKLLDTGLQYYSQKNLNEQAQANTQKNMRLASDLALRNQYQSIVNTPMAMRAAGLNPALMNQGVSSIAGVGSPIAGPSGQMGRSNSSTYAENVLAAKQIALLDAQKRNIDADTQQKQQDVEESKSRVPTYGQSVEESKSRIGLNSKQGEMLDSLIEKYGAEWLYVGQQYKRMLDADDKATKLIKEQYQYRASLAEKQGNFDLAKYWQDLADGSNKLSVGTLYAMRDFASYINDLDEYDKQMVARSLQKQLIQMQLNDGSVLYDMAHMPVAEFEKLIADTADAYASRDMRQAYASIGIPSEASYREQMEKTTRHNDFVGNIKDGNYKDAVMSQVPNFIHLVEEGALIYMLRGRAGAPMSAAPSVPYSSMNPADIKRSLELSKNEIKALKQAKKSADNNRRLGELYREEKELTDRLKRFNATDYAR